MHVVDVACHDGFGAFFLVEPIKGSHDVVIAVVSNLNELMGHAQGFGLLLDDFEAVESVGFHVNVGNKAYYFMTLLNNLV
jgi:hypothetical protein